MSVFFITIGIVVICIAFFFIYRSVVVSRQNTKLNEIRFGRIEKLHTMLEEDRVLSKKDILPFAENLLTRQLAFELLTNFKRIDLFPKEYYSIVKSAESILANWLEKETELGTCPDEIDYIKRVTFDYDGQGNWMHYEVFKFRVNPPHWASDNGWILGVVGPYFDDSKPYYYPGVAFSRINDALLEKVTPEEEAEWVHKNLSMR